MIWDNECEGIADQSESDNGLELHKAIKTLEHRFPYGGKYTTPQLVGKTTLRTNTSRTQSDVATQCHVFQFGPRAWTSRHLRTFGKPPKYEEALIEIGSTLEKLDWQSLAQRLFETSFGRTPSEKTPPIDLLLVRQVDETMLVMKDPVTTDSIVYKVEHDQFRLLGRPQPQTFVELDSAPYRPVRSLTEGSLRDTKKGERAGKIDELKQMIAWRFGTRLEQPDLVPLLIEAGERMAKLGQNVAIAYSASRFNDANNDDRWSAVRVDDVSWESGSYFGSNGPDPLSLFRASSVIHTALGLLHHLLACNLFYCIERSFGTRINPMDAVGLFLQEGKLYLAWSSTNGDDGPAYVIDMRRGNIELVGFAPRFDWHFNTGPQNLGRGVPAEKCLKWMAIDEWVERVCSGNTGDQSFPTFGWEVLPWSAYAPPPS